MCTLQSHCSSPVETEGDLAMMRVFDDVAQHLAVTDDSIELPLSVEGSSIMTNVSTLRIVMGYFAVGQATADKVTAR